MSENKYSITSEGELVSYAWPGGYPVIYITEDNGVCARTVLTVKMIPKPISIPITVEETASKIRNGRFALPQFIGKGTRFAATTVIRRSSLRTVTIKNGNNVTSTRCGQKPILPAHMVRQEGISLLYNTKRNKKL